MKLYSLNSWPSISTVGNLAITEWLRLCHVWIIERTKTTLTKTRYETWWQWPWLQRNNSCFSHHNQIPESLQQQHQHQDHTFPFLNSPLFFYVHAIRRFTFLSFHALLHKLQKLNLKLLNLVSIWVFNYSPEERCDLLSSNFYF